MREDRWMYAITTFLVVAVVTVAFTKLATGALIATGMPPELAAFQARSAFSGAGFTTRETENVVNQPVRRKIIGTTMLVGSLGTPTLVVTVLAVRKGSDLLGEPPADIDLLEGDELILYGRRDAGVTT